MKVANIQILIIRLALAGLFLSLGWEKMHEGWLTSPQSLNEALATDRTHASGFQLQYLDVVAIPYAAVWSKLMVIGETALGISLLLGLLVRLSSLMAIIMVLNFYAANGSLYSLRFFGSPWSALLTGCLLVIFFARAGRWAGLDALLAKSNSKGILW